MAHQYNTSSVHDLPLTLNLVTNKWMDCLKNDCVFQDGKFPSQRKFSKSPFDYAILKTPMFNVTVVGYCKFVKSFDGKDEKPAIIINASEPLNEIAQVMTKDLGSVPLSDEFKFCFKNCSALGCSKCKEAFKRYQEAHYAVDTVYQPCICITRVYDGENIRNRFYSQMLKMFPQNFIAILHLSINARYHYTDVNKTEMYRISGIVNDILAFKDECNLPRTIDLGDLTPFMQPSNASNEKEMDLKEGEDNLLTNASDFFSMDENSSAKNASEFNEFSMTDMTTPTKKLKEVQKHYLSLERGPVKKARKDEEVKEEFLSLDKDPVKEVQNEDFFSINKNETGPSTSKVKRNLFANYDKTSENTYVTTEE